MLPSISASSWCCSRTPRSGFIIIYPELLFQAQFLGSNATLGSP